MPQKPTQPTFTGTANPAPNVAFFLSEGDRLELEVYGVANINGRRMTTAEVRAEVAKSPTQSAVKIADADPARAR